MVINMEKRFDILGNEVQIGDNVIIIHPRYHDFVNGTITKFTPKGFKVKFYNWSVDQFDETFVGYGVIKGKKKKVDKERLSKILCTLD